MQTCDLSMTCHGEATDRDIRHPSAWGERINDEGRHIGVRGVDCDQPAVINPIGNLIGGDDTIWVLGGSPAELNTGLQSATRQVSHRPRDCRNAVQLKL